MAYTLSNLLQDMYKELGQLNVSVATGGTPTTVVDSKLVNRYGDDDWKEGSLFVVRDAAGAGASPEGKFERVSAYANSTGTFTIASITNSTVSGDTFGFASEFYPLYNMIELANDGLRSLGDVTLVDTTTLEVVANQTEYAAAVAWKRRKPTRIDIQGRTGDANDNQWYPLDAWEYIPAGAGTAGLIVFRDQLSVGRDLRIWYIAQHPRLSAYSDVVNEAIHPELATWAGVTKALAWQKKRLGQGADDTIVQALNEARVEFERAKAEHPIYRERRRRKVNVIAWNNLGEDRDDFRVNPQ